MSLFGFLLLLLFLWFVVRPIARIFIAANRLRRAANDAAFGNSRTERKAGWTNPVKRRKKINRNIGEYIDYEEVTATEQPATPPAEPTGGEANYGDDERIVDAEWEDIK